jgi:hypothetical protein
MPKRYIYILMVTKLQEIYIGLDSFDCNGFERNQGCNWSGCKGYKAESIVKQRFLL